MNNIWYRILYLRIVVKLIIRVWEIGKFSNILISNKNIINVWSGLKSFKNLKK